MFKYHNWDIHNKKIGLYTNFFVNNKEKKTIKNNSGLSAKKHFLQITKFQAIAESKSNRTKTHVQ